MRLNYTAGVGSARTFNAGMLCMRDISKKSDKYLNEILDDPTASYFEKMEAFKEMSKRRKKQLKPVILASAGLERYVLNS